MNNNELKILVTAKDSASAVLRKVQRELHDATGSMASSMDGASFSSTRMGQAISGAADRAKASLLLLSKAGILAGAAATAFAVNSAADFEQSLNVFRAVSQATAEQMSLVAARARELGKDITLPGISSKDAASAMVELSKAGLSVNDTLAASKGVLALAKAGQLDTASAAEIAANALNAFSLEGAQASRVADLLAAGANASSATVSDMALGMQMASSNAASLKVPVEDLVTALAAMSNNAVKGSDAGTSLKTFMMSMAPTTNKAAKAMKKLNLDFFDAKGQFVGLRDVTKQLQTATKGLSDEQRSMAFETIFGSDAVRAANILAKEGVEGFDKLSVSVKKEGAAVDLAAAQNSGFKGALDSLKSSIETVAIDLGMKLLPHLTHLAEVVTKNIGPGVQLLKDKFEALWPQVREAATQIGDYLLPKLTALWKTISESFLPAMSDLVKTLGPTVGAGLVWAIGAALEMLDGLLKFISEHTWIVTALAVAFAAVKTAMFLNGAIQAFTGVMVAVRAEAALTAGSLGIIKGIMMNPLTWTLTVALAGYAIVKGQIDELNRVTDHANETIRNRDINNYVKLYKEIKEQRGQAAADSFARQQSRATGGEVQAGEAYTVGENHPETFVPNTSGRIDPQAPSGDTKNILSGNFYFSTAESVDTFFERLDKTQRLARMGLA